MIQGSNVAHVGLSDKGVVERRCPIRKKLLISAADWQGHRMMRQFLLATTRPRQVQERILLDRLRQNSDSEWGKQWGFATIKSIQTFQARLPLATYETFSPYIEKLKRGHARALLGRREKLLGFGLTSGTTGEPKFIPFTRSFVHEYQRTTFLFAYCAAKENPGLLETEILPIFSPAREYKTQGGLWCGSVSGWIAEHQISLIRSFYALPHAAHEIKDVHARYYTLMRLALTENVGTLMTANPSTILTLVTLADDKKEELIRDIHDGTLCVKELVEEHIFRALKPYLKKVPSRANELRALAEKSEFLAPRHYWPNLQLVACWKGGTLFTYLDQFPKYFSASTTVKDIGLLATEGRLSIPIVSGEDAGCLALDSVFFEFIPEEDEDQASPRTLLADELELNKNYFVVITTASGLTRYNIGDLVRVVGFLNKTPLIYFLNKGKHISSLTGEKISEYQVVTATHDISKEFSLHLSDFALCPCWAEIPYYAFLAEEQELGDRSIWPQFIARLDARLQELNIEYHSKRISGRLAPPTLKVLERHCFASRRQMGRHLEGRLEQYKQVYLSPSVGYDKDFPVIEEITAQTGTDTG